jgi:acyl carrier protein
MEMENPNPTTPSETDIQEWLTSYLSELLEVSPEGIVIHDTVASYGLDSSAAIGMVADLSGWLNCELDPELVYSYPTIESLARYLAGRTR